MLWVRVLIHVFIFEHTITFCWGDACQQYTVQRIMGSRG